MNLMQIEKELQKAQNELIWRRQRTPHDCREEEAINAQIDYLENYIEYLKSEYRKLLEEVK